MQGIHFSSMSHVMVLHRILYVECICFIGYTRSVTSLFAVSHPTPPFTRLYTALPCSSISRRHMSVAFLYSCIYTVLNVTCLSSWHNIYIYIYIYIEREREREKLHHELLTWHIFGTSFLTTYSLSVRQGTM